MMPTRTSKNRLCLRSLLLLALFVSLSGCSTGPKPGIQGKWEANIVSKRNNQGSKVIYEFLSDGTFNAMPPGDTTVVDKDKYQVIDDGRTVKFRSELVGGEAVCMFTGIAMQCETANSFIQFKKL